MKTYVGWLLIALATGWTVLFVLNLFDFTYSSIYSMGTWAILCPVFTAMVLYGRFLIRSNSWSNIRVRE
jgi:hypothetical protein